MMKRTGVKLLALLCLLLVGSAGCASQFSAPASTPAPEKQAPAAAGPAQPQSSTAATAKPAPPPAPPAKLNVGFSSDTLSYGPVYVAMSKGFFKDVGLDVELTLLQGSTAGNAALLNGDVDLITTGADSMVKMVETGKEVQAVYVLSNKQSFFLVVGKGYAEKKGVNLAGSLQDKVSKLKGITLGAPSLGGKTELYTRWIMRRGGLKDDEVSVVKTGSGAAMVAALEGGQVDGFVASPPAPQEAALRGKAVVLVGPADIPEFDNHIATFLLSRKDRAEQNAEVLKRMASALDRAKEYIQKDFAGALQVAKERFPKMQEQSLEESLRFYIGSYGLNGRMNVNSWKNAFQFITDTTEGNPTFDPTEGLYWTNKYMP